MELLANGHESIVAFGRGNRPSASRLLKIGSKVEVRLHGLRSLLCDGQGHGSATATRQLIGEIQRLKPDVIHLHNAHGYYLNTSIFFEFLQTIKAPLVWTLHDSWAYTGHCTFYGSANCSKWEQECFSCPKTGKYPRSLFDFSTRNFREKKKLFTALENVHLVVPSRWLASEVSRSFLRTLPCHVIHNGVDTEIFQRTAHRPRLLQGEKKKIVLGVASVWDPRKGLADFIALSSELPDSFKIALIGLSASQIKKLPTSILGIARTEDIHELAAFYSSADVFVNPTWQDNFPTTNLEALACGTPVITYRTGGSPEAVNELTGRVVPQGDIRGLAKAIEEIVLPGKESFSTQCRNRAVQLFERKHVYREYINLYQRLVS